MGNPEEAVVVTLDPKTGEPFVYPANEPPKPPDLCVTVRDTLKVADKSG